MKLRQRRSPFTVTSFEITNHLFIQERSLFNSREVEIDLRRVVPAPLRIKEAPVRWLVTAAFFTLFALFCIYDGWGVWDAPAAVGLFFTGGIAVACWYNSWRLHRNILVFRDRGTQQPAFFMLRASPSPEAVDAFVAQIAIQAERPLPPPGAGHAETIAHHAHVLQYLLEAGVLLADEYRIATERLHKPTATAPVLSIVQGKPHPQP